MGAKVRTEEAIREGGKERARMKLVSMEKERGVRDGVLGPRGMSGANNAGMRSTSANDNSFGPMHHIPHLNQPSIQ